jgi:hypothetical protein
LPPREAARPSLWAVSADGIRLVFGNRKLLTPLLFGWLAGFYIVPEGLAAPYGHSLHGSTATVGLLMAAMPFSMVIGAFVLSRMATPSTGMRMMGWLAILSCVPLIGSAADPPLWAVLALWALAGAGSAYQLAAAGRWHRSSGLRSPSRWTRRPPRPGPRSRRPGRAGRPRRRPRQPGRRGSGTGAWRRRCSVRSWRDHDRNGAGVTSGGSR